MILLVDLDTGQTMEADPYALRDGSRPPGNWVIASEVTLQEWIDALKRANARWN